MGVRNAIEKAEKALETYKDKKVYALGPLIHNPVVLEKLKKQGLIILDEKDDEKIKEENVVIIRAHGISPLVEAKLRAKRCIIINATCPRVTVSQRKAEEYAKNGYTVILAGDKAHGEVEGIAGFAGKNFVLLRNTEDAKSFIKTNESNRKEVLLCQSTFSPLEFEKITNIIKEKNEKLEVLNTICPATKKRQAALLELCPKVQGVLVIGGKNSANTRRLYEKASSLCSCVALIERPEEIPESFFDLEKVGITAGASTPDDVIEESVNCLKVR